MYYGAVTAPSSLGLRFLRDNACLLTPVGSTLPTPQSCGLSDLPHVPCSPFAPAPLPWQQFCARAERLAPPGPKPQGGQMGLPGYCCHSDMSHQPHVASTEENRSSTPYTLFAENNLSLTGTVLLSLNGLPYPPRK